jgi:hypothetical protein
VARWPSLPARGNCDDKRIGRLTGKSSRPRSSQMLCLRKTFTVRIGSIFEDSRFPLHLCSRRSNLLLPARRGSALGKSNGPSVAA